MTWTELLDTLVEHLPTVVVVGSVIAGLAIAALLAYTVIVIRDLRAQLEQLGRAAPRTYSRPLTSGPGRSMGRRAGPGTEPPGTDHGRGPAAKWSPALISRGLRPHRTTSE